jgi:hypothetical protein
MRTDREIYTLLGADAETLAILTDGIRVRGPYRFEALEVKGLDRRTDGVLLPEAPEEPIWGWRTASGCAAKGRRPLSVSRPRSCLSPCAKTWVFFSWLTFRFSHMSYREILTMFGIQTSFEETRAYKDLVAIGHEKGLEEGEEKGREKGRQEEAAALLLRQARRRFGPLPPELEVRLDALPLARLEALADAIFDLDSQSDLRDWMGRP